MNDLVRTCRVCGYTDNDCTCCIQRTGRPCHWVEEDLCSACADGWNTMIRVRRGNPHVASVRVGKKTYRSSTTGNEEFAVNSVAEKAALAVGASGWRVERYRALSSKAARGALYLEFIPEGK